MPFSCHQFKTNGNLFSFLYPKWNSNAPGEYLLPIFLPVCWFWAISCWILLLLLLFPSPHPSCTVTMENDPEVCIHQDRLWIISGFHQQPIKLWMDPVACTRHRGCAFGYMLKSHQWNPELEAKGHCHLYQTIKAVSQLRGCTQVVEVFINMWLRTASSKLIQAPKESGFGTPATVTKHLSRISHDGHGYLWFTARASLNKFAIANSWGVSKRSKSWTA